MGNTSKVETKHEKFLRLAEARTNKTLEMIRLIENLSNTANYSYKPGDVDKMFDRLERELKKARERFEKNNSQNDRVFKF